MNMDWFHPPIRGRMKKPALMLFFWALLSSQLMIAQQPREYPLVLRADVPIYPPLARTAKITGKVQVQFTIKAGEVIAAEAKTGHPFLVKATTENIRSWRFPPEANGIFTATFVYELRGNETGGTQNPKIEMQLPIFVKIIALPIKPTCNDCGADIVGKPVEKGAIPPPSTIDHRFDGN
jgi:hypothetical protein